MPITRSTGRGRHTKPSDTTFLVSDAASTGHAETHCSSHPTAQECSDTRAYTPVASLLDSAPAQCEPTAHLQPLPSGNATPGPASNLHPLPVPCGGVKPTVTADVDHSVPDLPRDMPSRAHSRISRRSSKSKAKAKEIAETEQRLLQLKIQLETSRLAALKADSDSEDSDDIDAYSDSTKVEAWLDNIPEKDHLLRHATAKLHKPLKEESLKAVSTLKAEKLLKEEESLKNSPASSPVEAVVKTDFRELTVAITKAITATHRPKFVELPVFYGSHMEWLSFRAAYFETEQNFSSVENLNRLRKNLKGRAREAVESLLITSTSPSEIMKALEIRFGRPESIAKLELSKLRALPRLTESPRDICIFSSKVTNAVTAIRTLDCSHFLYNPEVTSTMVEKLTSTLRNKYYEFAAGRSRDEPDLIKFEKFMRKEAELCSPFADPENTQTQHIQSNQQRRSQKVHKVTEKQSTSTPKCPVCEAVGHSITDCETFKKTDESSRWDIAKEKRLCFRCLRYRNKTHRCRSKECGIDDCKRFHHSMLHSSKKEDTAIESEKVGSKETINSAWTIAHKQSYLKIIPVQACGPKGMVNTFALLDDGSTITLIDDSIAEKIGAEGPIDPLRIESINELKTTANNSRRVNFTLKGSHKNEEHIQARTIKNLQVAVQEISRNQLKGCTHLKDISEELVYQNAKPKILIGQDNWHLLLSTETRKGNHNQPVASLTQLGWVLHGAYTRTLGRNLNCIHHITKLTEDKDDLDELVKEYFAMDNLCINPKKPKSDPEEQALRILEQNTVQKEDGKYETALLWKKDDCILPDNYQNTVKRLINIEKKIDRDPNLKKKYTEQMEALISKGYAEPAPATKTSNRTWYLPHFAVVNPMKPDKLRVVHDAAAKTKGVALNDLLLKGPDLLQSLPGVIMRFRQYPIAVTADIKEMFMQVKLRKEDRDALRYLWRGNRRDNQPPEEYRMTSLIFGASSSPSTAIFVKNLNATKYQKTHPEAAAAIVHKHYVDDYLDSFKNLKDATRIASGVRDIHKEAGFELKQWKSNSALLLDALGENKLTENLELYKSEEKMERVLGLIWKPATDELTFNLDMTRIPPSLIDGKTPTKREALRIVMSLFDPLGFASPITIRAKQILQEVWRRGTGWDEKISEDLAEQWHKWVAHLKQLNNVTIPRCYSSYSDAVSLQLHIFTDASESAYSTILFWRATAPSGEVSVSIIMAKAKVAPLKLTSIPRLELQAAVMGTRLAEAVIEEHEKKPDSKTFWTDSKTVLAWIKTGSRSYKPFVAHRLAAIEDSSTVNEWRWIPTKLNVADDATRDVPEAFNKNHRWYKGPKFLYENEDSWPTETTTVTEPTGEEKVNHMSVNRVQKLSEALPDPTRFSNWDRLRYATARVLQFIQLCQKTKESVNYKRTKVNTEQDPTWQKTIKKKVQKTVKNKSNDVSETKERTFLMVSAETLRQAEELLMRSSQEDSFAHEIEDIRKQRPSKKESRLHQLSVEYIDGALRLRSRIQAITHVPDQIKRPLVVDGNHPTVKLWIRSIHQRMHHTGVEATVNECRQQYWVLRLRPVTRTIVRQCLRCMIKNQVPPYPRTGELPSCRLAHHSRPFTFTGVDYFGPLTITVGRTNQKRYVAIFTCLTTRAIHLEIASSLTTDSAIMALRRMIARRGCPTQIWSDNGTNLRGADKELRQAIDKVTSEEAAKKLISWRFIPPGAPFMGGAWERMVRAVKTALTSTLHERSPTEEVLATLLAEVEYTVNSRPLTHVSIDPNDPEALTPNHFILGGPGRVPIPGEFNMNDEISRTSWRSAQRLADIFWIRWLKEYLPDLQHRREPHGRGPNVKIGDLVLMIDNNNPRNVWIRGKVTAIYPGPDNIVRTVDIQTKRGVLRRPVRKLVVLPIEDVVSAPDQGATALHGGSNVQDDL